MNFFWPLVIYCILGKYHRWHEGPIFNWAEYYSQMRPHWEQTLSETSSTSVGDKKVVNYTLFNWYMLDKYLMLKCKQITEKPIKKE